MSDQQNSDNNNISSSQSIVTLNTQRLTDSRHPSSQVEHQMVIEIDKIIGRYLSRPDWSSPYQSSFEWTTQGQHVPTYGVKLVIKEPISRS